MARISAAGLRTRATTVVAAALWSALAVQSPTPAAQSPTPAAQTPAPMAQTPPPAAQTPPPAAGNSQNGKELYLKYSCYACHGYDGHGGGGARLVPMRMSLERFTAYVHNPRQMPPYTDKVLSDTQLADLFAYLKSLPESPPAKDIPLLMRIINGKT